MYRQLNQRVPVRRYLVTMLLIAVAMGCSDVEGPEHHHPAHKPEDYVAAVEQLQRLHKEILGKPLVVRTVRASHHHHDHHHDHSHGHDDADDHAETQLDALQELSDVVRWLPALAADSDLEEAPWNRVHEAAADLTSILAGFPDADLDRRQEAYRHQSARIEKQFAVLEQVAERLPGHHHDQH